METLTTWKSTTNQMLVLRGHLIAEQVTCAVMEATGDYWKLFHYLLEDAGFEVMLVNARYVKNLPGRKTDVSEAIWLALLGAHGLVRGSFVPPEPIRQVRDLTGPGRRSPGNAVGRSSGWRSCSRTPGSSCPRLPRTSSVSRDA